MADNQNSDESNDSPVIRDLRNQLKQVTKERDQYMGQVRTSVLSDSFSQFGLDPSKGPGKFVAQSYDGDLDPEAVSSWLEEQEFSRVEATQDEPSAPPGPSVRQEVEARGDAIRQSSDPGGAQRVGHDEWMKMLGSDPGRARQLHDSGLVDMPGHIASQLSANANSGPFG